MNTRTHHPLATAQAHHAAFGPSRLLKVASGALCLAAMALPAQARIADLSAPLALVAATESSLEWSALRKAGELAAPLAVVAAPENAVALLTIRSGNSASSTVAQQQAPQPLAQALVARSR